ncbi:MAG: aminopeptidase, partial [Pseudobutyrivibrio sp.]|nr:aminopeptidase [Pseudobutyrivibrio sp.]
NKQMDYDHKEDKAFFFDKAMADHDLECIRNAFEKHKEKAAVYGGPAVIETFGDVPFEPKNKAENPKLSDKQNKLNVYFMSSQGQMINEYIHGDERSFTIIAYPIPEIGEDFKEIFDETVVVNTLDYELYKNIQKYIIDALDQGEAVHVTGRGDNHTDITVKLQELTDPATQTIFENCVADVNIPVGEVFTSPKLVGTKGVLHVTKVYLNELCYRNLELTFEDGKITEYTCSNFEAEEENKKLIKDNVLFKHDTLPLGEFAIGTNTTAYRMGQRFGIADKLPILIAEKTGPHFAVGDTCYSHAEDVVMRNPDGKECIARDNSFSLLRKEGKFEEAYFNCHTDITIPYDELGDITVLKADGTTISIIEKGRFVLPGTEELNKALN